MWGVFSTRMIVISLAVAAAGCLLGACSSLPQNTHKTLSPRRATSKPYTIKGVCYRPQQHYEYDQQGVASYYGVRDGFHGKKTSTGEIFNAHALTAAHKTLPLPSVVLVTNLENGRSLKLKVNDRGPFVRGRIIDVSQKSAQLLGFYNKGIAKIRVKTLVRESLSLSQNPKAPPPIRYAKVGSGAPVRNGYRGVKRAITLAGLGEKKFIPIPKRRPRTLV